jgi:hypothetical protein
MAKWAAPVRCSPPPVSSWHPHMPSVLSPAAPAPEGGSIGSLYSIETEAEYLDFKEHVSATWTDLKAVVLAGHLFNKCVSSLSPLGVAIASLSLCGLQNHHRRPPRDQGRGRHCVAAQQCHRYDASAACSRPAAAHDHLLLVARSLQATRVKVVGRASRRLRGIPTSSGASTPTLPMSGIHAYVYAPLIAPMAAFSCCRAVMLTPSTCAHYHPRVMRGSWRSCHSPCSPSAATTGRTS